MKHSQLIDAGIFVAASGCDAPVTPEALGRKQPTFLASQSETALAVVPAPAGTFPPSTDPPQPERVVVTYNDDTGNVEAGSIIYTDTERTVLPGASLLGWSYSDDAGTSWMYGGKLAPPPGWSVLWGDPAITRSADGTIWISNVAAPDFKFPATGVKGGIGDFLGGACIARSTDHGHHFTNYDCVTNDGHFYDGGNMESTADGSVWAAYWDVNTQTVALWRSLGGPFELVEGSPFPDNPDTEFREGYVVTHPRLRELRGVPGQLGAVLYVAAQVLEPDTTVSVWINRYIKDCPTCSFRWDHPVRALTQTTFQPTIQLAPWRPGERDEQTRILRAGPQFTFDVLRKPGPDPMAVDEIRVVATRETARKYLVGARCPSGVGCVEIDGWSTLADAPASQFNPNVRVNLEPPRVWKLSWLSTSGGEGSSGDVEVWHGNLQTSGSSQFPRLPLVAAHEVCSDRRGYWGDYDDLQVLREPRDGAGPLFVRAESDSDLGCVLRQEFNERHLHVSAVRFP